MQITLIRHGMTPGNAKRQYIGRTDEPLSEVGAQRIEALGSDPEREYVYVSPLLRTQQTAALLFPNARQIVAGDLREMDFGDFERRSADDMINDPAYTAWVEANCVPSCPNGESMEGFAKRVCAEFSRILAKEIQKGSERVTFVVHGGVIMAIMACFCKEAKEYYTYSVDNGQGYVCTAEWKPGLAPVLTGEVLWMGF